jgi:uncharacterized protein (DUF983 family)
MAYDDPAAIQADEARQELRGRPGGGGGYAAFDLVMIAIAIVGAAIAFEEIDHWSQWVVLGGIVFTVIGFMIALSPNRRG